MFCTQLYSFYMHENILLIIYSKKKKKNRGPRNDSFQCEMEVLVSQRLKHQSTAAMADQHRFQRLFRKQPAQIQTLAKDIKPRQTTFRVNIISRVHTLNPFFSYNLRAASFSNWTRTNSLVIPATTTYIYLYSCT